MSSPARSSAATNDDEPLLKKTKKPPLIPSLPDDLLLSIFARISRLYYPCLSLVSNRFRSLLISPELNKTRSLLGHTESCLYVCLRFPHDQNPRWFTLCHKPTLTTIKKTKKSSGYVLATIPIPNSPQSPSGVVSVGSSIYTIGGPINGSNVWVLDCHTHTWSKAPSMSVERDYPAANVFDGKIYVTGGCNSSNGMEVFNPKTRVWENVLSPQCNSRVSKSAVIGDRIYYMFGKEGLVYKTRESKWEPRGLGVMDPLDLRWSRSCCVVDNVLYCCSNSCGLKSGLQWYDFKRHCWIQMKGLKGMPKFAGYSCVKLADYGGKLAVLWTRDFLKHTRISCAVIVFERRDNGDIWGNVEWSDPVLNVPNGIDFVCAIAATV